MTLSGRCRFSPDLIVEVTTVCDRKCQGCYASNVLSKKAPEELYESQPEFFLSPEKFEKQLESIIHRMGSPLSSIAIRGGEPSRHPDLSSLLRTAHQWSHSVYLETHGRWIQPVSFEYLKDVLKTCSDLGTFVKLSFDKMHGLSVTELRNITSALSKTAIQWELAITEQDLEQFSRTRNECSWIADEQIYFQKKAISADMLIQPPFGVIRVDGSLSQALSTHLPLYPISQFQPGEVIL